jgi:hypothetical protein
MQILAFLVVHVQADAQLEQSARSNLYLPCMTDIKEADVLSICFFYFIAF